MADSLASGVGFLIGMYATDVFGEARKSPAGFLIVDFLNGTIQGRASASLASKRAAYEWKRESELQLRMEIEIEAALLRSLRAQLAEFRQLEGTDLTLRFLCETPEEVERTMCGKRTWWEEVNDLWIGYRHPENPARAA